MRARGLAATAFAAALLALAAPAAALDLEGTWYVLVHYQDAESTHPDAWRWDDRVWRFRAVGERLEWTEWPLVVFEDETGRFETVRGRSARVVAAWEPSPAQLADVRDGLQVNSRGVKTKTLERVDGGWSSQGGGIAESATVLTYSEVFRIEGGDRPVFVREDALGGGTAEAMEGRTEYRTEQVAPHELRGSFTRDGSRIGRFRMIRSGESTGLRTAARTQEELQRKAAVKTLLSNEEMRLLVRDRIEEQLSEAGVSLPDDRLDALLTDALQALARGQSPDQIAPDLARTAEQTFFDFAARGARHDDTVRYRWPFDPSTPRRLGQGPGGSIAVSKFGGISTPSYSHEGAARYAFDFVMPVGTPVLAARAGQVVRVVDGFTEGGPQKSLAPRANVVVVLHDDGTFAQYVHLSPGVAVKPGQRVAAGDLLGKSGNTGYTTGPHLHFEVARLDEEGRRETVDIRFDDGSKRGVVPVAGAFYGGQGGARAGDAAAP